MTVSIPMPPGRTIARFMKALAVAKGDPLVAVNYAENHMHVWGDALNVKAAIQAIGMGRITGEGATVGNDFMAAVRPRTILGRLTLVRQVPFLTRLLCQTTGAKGYWVNESEAAPPSSGSFTETGQLRPLKVAAMSVVTDEAARAVDATESLITRDLVAAAVETLDSAFIDPGNSGVPGVKPSSITHNAIRLSATDNPVTDVAAAISAFNGNLLAAAWVMHPAIAASLRLRGQPFENLSVLGGSLLGLPVLTSRAVPFDSDGLSPIVLLDQSAIDVAGGLTDAEVRSSSEGALFMDDTAGAGAAQLVSLFQANCTAFMATIPVNFAGKDDAAVVIEGASHAA